MNTKETVMLNSDTNYIPVKYSVIEVAIGNSLAASYAWLKCISYGFDTKIHLDDFVESLSETTQITTGIQGTLGEYQIVALNAISSYIAKASNHDSNYPVG